MAAGLIRLRYRPAQATAQPPREVLLSPSPREDTEWSTHVGSALAVIVAFALV